MSFMVNWYKKYFAIFLLFLCSVTGHAGCLKVNDLKVKPSVRFRLESQAKEKVFFWLAENLPTEIKKIGLVDRTLEKNADEHLYVSRLSKKFKGQTFYAGGYSSIPDAGKGVIVIGIDFLCWQAEKNILVGGSKKYRSGGGYFYRFVLSEVKGELLVSEAVAQGIGD
ncbi:MAG: hypothetical protein AB7K68_00745 [Bacteriovoracia bacterium]